MNKDKIKQWMAQGQALLNEENMPSNEGEQMKAKLMQQSMDLGGESPNQPSLSEDAISKDEGGFKSNFVANGGGQSEDEQRKLRAKAFVAMMSKGK